ncbi:MAG: hypothetical protein KKF27_20735 [Gammaproteobacteria bacterium]|nr:hypothetical protein [Gammaproteobacteria bacterium]
MRKFKLTADEAGELMQVGADSPSLVRELDRDVLVLVVGEEKAAKIKKDRRALPTKSKGKRK